MENGARDKIFRDWTGRGQKARHGFKKYVFWSCVHIPLLFFGLFLTSRHIGRHLWQNKALLGCCSLGSENKHQIVTHSQTHLTCIVYSVNIFTSMKFIFRSAAELKSEIFEVRQLTGLKWFVLFSFHLDCCLNYQVCSLYEAFRQNTIYVYD